MNKATVSTACRVLPEKSGQEISPLFAALSVGLYIYNWKFPAHIFQVAATTTGNHGAVCPDEFVRLFPTALFVEEFREKHAVASRVAGPTP